MTDPGTTDHGPDGAIRAGTFAALDPPTLYALLRLRVDVFVVEQACPYPELDGRDCEPDTEHLWVAARDGTPVGCLRVLAEPDGTARIGRVAVAEAARGAGVASRLMTAALARVGDRECWLDAQSHLVGFYRRFGFAVAGDDFRQDGILHTPMRLSPEVAAAPEVTAARPRSPRPDGGGR